MKLSCFIKMVSAVFISVFFSGCGSLMNKKVSTDYPSYDAMIASEFKEQFWVPIDLSPTLEPLLR